MAASDPTAADRMRRHRQRKRAAGLVEERSWAEPPIEAPWSDHLVADVRSLALHAIVARRLVREPELREAARAVLERWAERAGSPAPAWVTEWRAILDRSPESIATFLVSMSEDAVRLRSSSPFAVLVDPERRRALFDAFRERP